MRASHLFLLLLLITVLSCALPVLCFAQNGDSLQVSLDPLPDDNNSMDWWLTWLPSWESNVSFRAALKGDMQDLNTGKNGFIQSTKYVFSFPLENFTIDGIEYDADVSSYTGYCMNTDVTSAAGYDIIFRQDDQPTISGVTYTVSPGGLSLVAECSSPRTYIDVVAFVKDYAAHGILKVEVEVNQHEGSVTPTDDETLLDALSVPLDNNGNDIADGWFGDATVTIMEGNVTRNGYDPWADEETGPGGNSNPGDGLTVFEEYRGFDIQHGHTRELESDTIVDSMKNPLVRKDLFIYSDFKEGYGYASNLPTSPFRLHTIDFAHMFSNTKRITKYQYGVGKQYPRDNPGENRLGFTINGDPQSAVYVMNGTDNQVLETAEPQVHGKVRNDNMESRTSNTAFSTPQ